MTKPRWTVVALLAALAWACGSDTSEGIADAMIDSGRALEDAGELIRDSGSDAAVAQTIVTAECDVEDGGVLYAEATIDVDPSRVTDARAIMCGMEGSAPAGLGGLDCSAGTVRFAAHRARVQCGGGDPTTTGYRWRTVRIYIDE